MDKEVINVVNITQQVLEREERELLREQMLKPEELFLLQYLKNANRKAAQHLQFAYGWDVKDDY
jgi:hypothetical protein